MRRAHKLSGGLTYLRAEVTRLETSHLRAKKYKPKPYLGVTQGNQLALPSCNRVSDQTYAVNRTAKGRIRLIVPASHLVPFDCPYLEPDDYRNQPR
jgi:hypothetical protein